MLTILRGKSKAARKRRSLSRFLKLWKCIFATSPILFKSINHMHMLGIDESFLRC